METSIFVVYEGLNVLLYAYEKKGDGDSDGSQFVLVKETQLEPTGNDRGDALSQWITSYLSNHADDTSHIQLKIVSNDDLGRLPPIDAISDVSVISVSEFELWRSDHHITEIVPSATFRIHRSHGIVHYGSFHMDSPDQPFDHSHISLWLDVGSDKRIEVLSTKDPLISTFVFVPVWTGKNLLRLKFLCFQDNSYTMIGRIEFDYDKKSQIIVAVNSQKKDQKQLIQIKVHHIESHRCDCFYYDERSDRIMREDGCYPVLMMNHVISEDDCVIADIDLNSSGEVPAGPDTSNGPRSLFQTVSKRDITGALYDENWLISRLRGRCWATCQYDHDEWFIGELSETGERVQGTVLTSQGDLQYIGEWNGRGTLYHIPSLPNCLISGQFHNGVITGEAVITNALTMSVVFRGEIHDVASGRATGTIFFNNIKTYKGELSQWKPDGDGQLYCMNGVKVYEGSFVAGYPQGKGKQFCYNAHFPMTLQGTEREEQSLLYEGEFFKGMKDGVGKLVNKEKQTVYDGEWKKNQIDGDGKMWIVETEGECADYVRQSFDILKAENEKFVDGRFYQGQIHMYVIEKSLCL